MADSDSLRSLTYSDFDGEDNESTVHIEWVEDYACLTFSCPDRTGLGFRLARIVFDFGLSVKQADFYTDGQWCYVKLMVKAQSSEPDENLINTLRRRLEAECPPNQRRVTQYYENPIPFRPPGRYQLQIRMKDKIGIFHGNSCLCCLEGGGRGGETERERERERERARMPLMLSYVCMCVCCSIRSVPDPAKLRAGSSQRICQHEPEWRGDRSVLDH